MYGSYYDMYIQYISDLLRSIYIHSYVTCRFFSAKPAPEYIHISLYVCSNRVQSEVCICMYIHICMWSTCTDTYDTHIYLISYIPSAII